MRGIVRRAEGLRPPAGQDCDWSRPVKKASFSGAVSRSGFIQDTAISSASSQEISSKAPDPRGPTRAAAREAARAR
jgi:hypothetical protein